MLVDDELLPGARLGADLARQPRLPGGLHGGDDAEGSEARAGCRAPDAFGRAARCRCRRSLSTLRRRRRRRRGFFRYHSLPARGVIDERCSSLAPEDRMIDHVGFPVSDYERSRAFYAKALAPLGYALVMEVDQAENYHQAAGFVRNGKPD